MDPKYNIDGSHVCYDVYAEESDCDYCEYCEDCDGETCQQDMIKEQG